jgi:predicted O-methyltransferase YrrM
MKKKIFIYKDIDGLSSEYVTRKIIDVTRKKCGGKNHYVEIGTFRGFTSINNSLNNKNVKCITIDNFKFDKKNQIKFKKSVKKYSVKNLKLINCDYEKAFEILKKNKIKIGLLFIDGPHDYRAQYVILEKFKALLSKNACIIVDDANYNHVKLATLDFLNNNKEFKLISQKYSKTHPVDKRTSKKKLTNWNGIHVIEKNSKKNSVKLKINKNLALKFHIDSHDIQRHYFGNKVLEVMDNLFYYFKTGDNKYLNQKLRLIYNKNKSRTFKSNF